MSAIVGQQKSTAVIFPQCKVYILRRYKTLANAHKTSTSVCERPSVYY